MNGVLVVTNLTSELAKDSTASHFTDLILQFSDRILPVRKLKAIQAAKFWAQRRRVGRRLVIGDTLIADTSKVNDLALATRNFRNFEYLELELVNPWPNSNSLKLFNI